MATVDVAFKNIAPSGQIARSGFSTNQTFTSSASSQATTAGANANEYAQIVVSGGNIRYTVAATPTAVADGTCELVLDGERIEVDVPTGHKVAIIDA